MGALGPDEADHRTDLVEGKVAVGAPGEDAIPAQPRPLLRRGRTPYHLTDLSRWAGAAIDEMLSALLERITVGRAPGR
jgi:hypothetical protein